jgi:hypothetical protein
MLYVNCDKDALYSDIQRLIKAARAAHTTQIALLVKSKPGWMPLEVYRSPRRKNQRK